MSMKYRLLTTDQQRQKLEQRVLALEVEHFDHEMILQAAAALPDGLGEQAAAETAAQVVASEEAQAIIEAAHEAIVAELDALAEPDSAD